MMRSKPFLRVLLAVVAVVAAQSCTVKQTETPDLTGPSNFQTPPGPAGPIARFTVNPEKPTANLPAAFDGTSSCPEGGFTGGCTTTDRSITTFTWDFGDGTGGTGPSVSHSFRNTGAFNVTLSVVSDRGLGSSTIRSVQVDPGTPPKAEFVFSPTNPAIGQSVSFNASQSTPGPGHNIASYAWDFGDGGRAGGVSPNHSFGAAGGFNVVLTVTDEVGQSASIAKSVPVAIAPSTPQPTADFVISPTDPSVNQSVLFNASQSRAATGHSIVSYSWNFGDGGTGSGVTATHPYGAAGTYSAVLQVTDDIGQTASTSKTVTVSNTSPTQPPTAVFTFSPSAPALGDTVFFNASNSAPAPGRTIASYKWTFGDNSAPVTSGSPTTTHVYSAASGAGSYTVVLVVTDDVGKTATTSQSIPVGSPPAPTAAFVYSPAQPAPAQPIVFDASLSSAAQGQTIVDYAWVFGDDPTIIHTPNKTITHTYTQSATYTVSLRVTDSAGRVSNSSATQQVTVGGATANFTFTPSPGTANSPITFNGSGSLPSSGASAITTWVWNFGDSTGVFTDFVATRGHTFTAPGTYTVTLTVTDNLGRTGTVSKSVVVN
jgi:PKD repeat protein